MRKLQLCLMFLAAVVTSSVSAQTNNSETKQAAEYLPQLRQAADFYRFRADQFVVEGPRSFESNILAATQITFEAGSQLIFSPSAVASGTIYIVADRIEVKGPAVLSWLRDVPPTPPARSKAPDGAPGRGEGASGERGSDGEAGNPGFPGKAAPTVIVVTKELNGTPLRVDLRGEPGGQGGRGQDGGNGGRGARGASASSSAFDCKRGPGSGGKGGDGGAGGYGGVGGAGGNGGDLLVLTSQADVTSRFILLNEGGLAGPPGEPGEGGQPGPPGEEGPSAGPWCSGAGRRGAPGLPGPKRHATPEYSALAGVPGRFIHAPLSERQLTGALP